ncbi:exonuclease domain-containing protein [Arenibacter sp. GZD96]|uniref:exonuclease domain-containing protein n=1 Tax=Aurantibrevibacter litoralis TaxID=3106030 RepID=UPI002B0008BF|nr:exonuclease domain-containing protein [Arenibacter sp. GZD-96]MEA1786359.1 exonuclease domain-containing protein [Arenibacter sp. GZD-96]
MMYAILDIETTGGKYNEEGITEIAIHKFDGHEVVDVFISLVNPEKEIQPFVVNLTGINNHMLQTAPKFYEVAKRIVEITENAIIVAHNAQFDYRILRTEFRRLGYSFERKTLCTVDLSKSLIPNAASYSLGKLVRSLGIPVSDRHRANGDALATLKLFKLLLDKDLDKTILKSVIRAESLGELTARQLDMVAALPSETGVYYLHNKEGDVLFLGKSRNIKKRVNQHFTGTNPLNIKLQKETKKVTFERTGSELIADLKAHEALLRLRPRYLKNLRGKRFTHGLYSSMNEDGYRTLRILPEHENPNPIGTFRSYIAGVQFLRQISEEFQLCDKLVGLSEAKKNCSKYTDQNCLGACIQKEQPMEYNERVFQAIQRYSLTSKNILLTGKGRNIGERSAVLIKNGIFKGLGFYELNHQIYNPQVLDAIIVPVKWNINAQHIIEHYYRKQKDFKTVELKS